jgi:hypothetical protein
MAGRYALLIGNSSFRHRELSRLAAPANDVRALSATLEDEAIGGFRAELELDVVVKDAKAAVRRLVNQRVQLQPYGIGGEPRAGHTMLAYGDPAWLA